MNPIYVLTFGIAALLLMGTGYVFHRRRPEVVRSRWWFIPPLLFWLAFCTTFLKWLDVPNLDWSAARLSIGVAWAHGVKVFSLPGEGPFLCAAYGPMMPILYAPAALLKTPTLALLGGGVLSMLYFLGPCFLLLWPEKGADARRRFWSFCTMALFVALTHCIAGLNYHAYTIHVDGAAIGFCVLACGCLLRRRTPADGWWLSAAALFMVLAGSSKQIPAPLAVALPIYLWMLDGWRVALKYLLLLCALALAFAWLWHALFGLETLYYAVLYVPFGFPTGPGFWENLFNVWKKVKWILPWLIVGSLFGVTSIHACGGWRAWIRQPWVLLFLAGLALAPTSIRAMQVFNGSTNSLHCLALWVLSLCLLMREQALRMELAAGRKALGTLVLLLVVTTPLVTGLKYARRVERNTLTSFFENRREIAYRYARAHPGQAFFPWEPLSSVLAEGRAYHFDYGLAAQELAGLHPLRRTQLDPFVPSGMRLIAYMPNERKLVLAYYPEYSRCIEWPELPGFEVFVRPDDPLFAQARTQSGHPLPATKDLDQDPLD